MNERAMTFPFHRLDHAEDRQRIDEGRRALPRGQPSREDHAVRRRHRTVLRIGARGIVKRDRASDETFDSLARLHNHAGALVFHGKRLVEPAGQHRQPGRQDRGRNGRSRRGFASTDRSAAANIKIVSEGLIGAASMRTTSSPTAGSGSSKSSSHSSNRPRAVTLDRSSRLRSPAIPDIVALLLVRAHK